jgi:hypothetical protein
VKVRKNSHKVKSLDMRDRQKRLLLLQVETIGSIEELDTKEGSQKGTHLVPIVPLQAKIISPILCRHRQPIHGISNLINSKFLLTCKLIHRLFRILSCSLSSSLFSHSNLSNNHTFLSHSSRIWTF